MHQFYFSRLGLMNKAGESPEGGSVTPPKIVVPSLASLSAAAEKRSEEQQPPAAKVDDAPPNAPPAKVEDAPTGIPMDPYDDTPPEPTTPSAGKTDKDFIRERQAAKDKRKDAVKTLEQLEAEIAAERIDYAKKDEELTQLRAEREKLAKEALENKTLAEARAEEAEKLKTQYYEENKPVYSVQDDSVVREETGTIHTKLAEHMPVSLPGKDGNPTRVFFEKQIKNPIIAAEMDKALFHYSNALEAGDEKQIDLAVNYAAQLFGANVKIAASDAESVLLDPSSVEFQKIEEGMRAAVPAFRKRHLKMLDIKEQTPKLAIEKYEQHKGKIRESLTRGVMIDANARKARRDVDPHDSVALFAAIVESSPAIKQVVESKVALVADTFAGLDGRVNIPFLKSNKPEDIAEHQRKVAEIRNRQGECMQLAVIGASMGPILEALIAERDALQVRADAAALNSNPGDSTRRGPENQTQASDIKTDIYGD